METLNQSYSVQSLEEPIANNNLTVINNYQTTIQHANNIIIGNSVNETQNAVDSKRLLLEETIEWLKNNDHDWVQPIIWMENKQLDKIYIPPIIREEEKTGNISEDVSCVTLEEIINNLNETCKCIQIDGEAGCGKTILAQKLNYDWSQSENYMTQFKLVIHVSLSGVNKNNDIENKMLTELANDKEKEMKEVLKENARKILFLLDGLNDIETDNIVKFVKDFKKTFILSKFILFSRPLSDKVKNGNSLYKKKFYLYGFNEECIDKYIQQFFNEKPCQVKEMKKKIILNGEIKKICGPIPLFWHLVCILDEEGRSLPFTTITELYHSVVVMFSQYYWKKINPDKDLDKSEIPDDIQHALGSLGEMVFGCLQKRSTEFSVNKLEKVCGIENSKIILNLGILKKKKKSQSKLQYIQPVHVTFLEYVVAFYFSKINSRDLKEKFKELFSIQHLLHSKSFKSVGCSASFLVVFLCGLLKKKQKHFFCELKGENLYKSLLNLSFLLWQASGGSKEGLKKTIIDAAELLNFRFGSSWDIKWLFLKEKKLRTNNVNIQVLEEIFKNSTCQIRIFSLFNVQLYLLSQNEELFNRFLSALESNTTIEILHFDNEPESPKDFSQEQYLNAYKKCFNSMKKMKNLREISFNTDIINKNKHLNYTVLLSLLKSLRDVHNLELLHIKTWPFQKENLCIDFHDKNSVTQRVQKKNEECIAIKDDHIKEIMGKLKDKKQFKKLYIPQVKCENINTIQNFISFLNESKIEEFQLARLKIQNETERENLSKMMDQLLLTFAITLTHLDLQGTSLSLSNAKSIASILKENKILKSLNLAYCFQEEDQVLIIFETLYSSTLEKINMSSNIIFLQNETILKFKNIYLNITQTQSNLKTLILSGWKFQFRTFETLKSLAEFFSYFTVLENICLNSVEFRVESFSNDEILLEHMEKILKPSSCLKLVDVTSFKLQTPSRDISLCTIDSGIDMTSPLPSVNKEIQYPSYFTSEEQLKNKILSGDDLKTHFSPKYDNIKFCSSYFDILNALFS